MRQSSSTLAYRKKQYRQSYPQLVPTLFERLEHSVISIYFCTFLQLYTIYFYQTKIILCINFKSSGIIQNLMQIFLLKISQHFIKRILHYYRYKLNIRQQLKIIPRIFLIFCMTHSLKTSTE